MLFQSYYFKYILMLEMDFLNQQDIREHWPSFFRARMRASMGDSYE